MNFGTLKMEEIRVFETAVTTVEVGYNVMERTEQFVSL